MIQRKEIGLTFLLRTYLGLGHTTIEHSKREDRKSVGTERTFSAISTTGEFYAQLKKTSAALAEDLAKLEFSGRTINL
jgi:DNA polymerase kappa